MPIVSVEVLLKMTMVFPSFRETLHLDTIIHVKNMEIPQHAKIKQERTISFSSENRNRHLYCRRFSTVGDLI